MKKLALALAAFALVFGRPVVAQNAPSPEAQAAFDAARKLPYGDHTAVALAKKAISLDPDFTDAQEYYVHAFAAAQVPRTAPSTEQEAAVKKAIADLTAEYAQLSVDHPADAVYPWVLGFLYDYVDPDKSVSYYKKAISVDPKFGPAYDALGISSEEQGDLKQSTVYAAKAHEVWPNDAKIWRHYLTVYTSQADPASIDKAIEIAKELAAKFPDEGVSMLGYAADRLVDPGKRRALYEEILREYPKQAGGYTMLPLFSIYIASDPQAALRLADEMRKASAPAEQTNDAAKLWAPYYVKAVVDAQALIAKGNGSAAFALLVHTNVPSLADSQPLALTRAKALAIQGKSQEAYASLKNDFAARPSHETYPTLLDYGKKLGLNQRDVDASVEGERVKQSKDGQPFTLTDYSTGKSVSLADYKGRVVLVNFWYPKCGPCRGEFPYLQMALDKYKDRGFAILAINGHPAEDSWVMPLIRGWHLGFIPLKGTEDVLKAYKILSFPHNFLYGVDGRIYPMPRQVRPESLDEFEAQIEGLMAQAGGGPSAKTTASLAPDLDTLAKAQ
jgi:tetratricopeptide (TPR) repeat protein/thiol-disulfide isomerase/thioredoxin